MNSFSQFEENLDQLRADLAEHCRKYGRAVDSVRILPVTKRHPLEAVCFAEKAGLEAVGENVVQEAKWKSAEYKGRVEWELIGHLQSNKARHAVQLFDRIQTVDNHKLLARLNRIAGEEGKCQRILLQVNTAQDSAKHGLSPSEVDGLVESALASENLDLEGFMTIGALSPDPCVAEETFMRLREIRDRLGEVYGKSFPELSMGMSGDVEMAVKAGSTMVRVGTALYGERAL